MELFVDIADLKDVKRVAEYYPIDGFTTNPNILTKSDKPLKELMKEYREYVEKEDTTIFVQVTASKAEDMIRQAKNLYAFFGDHLVVKLPAVKEGYKAIAPLKSCGIKICVTVVHSMLQGLVAAKAGADYVAPYVSHIDNIGADGIQTVEDMVYAFLNGGYKCKVLGASFRTADQIKRLSLVGCHAVTITPQMFDALIAHPSTDESMVGFNRVWKETFGEEEVDDALR